RGARVGAWMVTSRFRTRTSSRRALPPTCGRSGWSVELARLSDQPVPGLLSERRTGCHVGDLERVAKAAANLGLRRDDAARSLLAKREQQKCRAGRGHVCHLFHIRAAGVIGDGVETAEIQQERERP